VQYGVGGIVFSSAFSPLAQAERQTLKATSYLSCRVVLLRSLRVLRQDTCIMYLPSAQEL
jgi:hypothetical protein